MNTHLQTEALQSLAFRSYQQENPNLLVET